MGDIANYEIAIEPGKITTRSCTEICRQMGSVSDLSADDSSRVLLRLAGTAGHIKARENLSLTQQPSHRYLRHTLVPATRYRNISTNGLRATPAR
jgi:hypothetical protein